MRRLAILLVVTALVGPAAPAGSEPRPAYPPTRVDDVVEILHGVEVHDPYRWLEDGASPEVQAWAKSQNDFAHQRLDQLPGRDKLARRLHDVSYVDSLGGPPRAGSPPFFIPRQAHQEKGGPYSRGGR